MRLEDVLISSRDARAENICKMDVFSTLCAIWEICMRYNVSDNETDVCEMVIACNSDGILV